MQKILGPMIRAIKKYDMIKDNDRIAVGISGGKDSILLVSALKAYQKFSKVKFELVGINIDLGWELDSNEVKKQLEYFKKINLKFIQEKTDIGPLIFNVRKESNPCSLCAKMRRGALNSIAKKYNCNKIALGHHTDDIIETFFLSLLHEGRLSTFAPTSYMSKSDIGLIRPFIFIKEQEIKNAVKRLNLPTVFNPCPADKHTKREDIKNLINKLNKEFIGSKTSITSAILNPERNNLWDKLNINNKI